jgi:hypothetical protein
MYAPCNVFKLKIYMQDYYFNFYRESKSDKFLVIIITFEKNIEKKNLPYRV